MSSVGGGSGVSEAKNIEMFCSSYLVSSLCALDGAYGSGVYSLREEMTLRLTIASARCLLDCRDSCHKRYLLLQWLHTSDREKNGIVTE